MPRKNGSISKRDVLPDPIYNSKLVTRLINKIMLDGKKGTAQTILYHAFEIKTQLSLSVEHIGKDFTSSNGSLRSRFRQHHA